MNVKTIIKSTLVLVAITLVAGLALAAVYEVTKAPIAAAEEAAKQAAWQAVMPEADTFTPLSEGEALAAQVAELSLPAGVSVDEVVEATRGETPVGFVITATSANGYGGNITVAMGILPDGSTLGISVISQSETAGLGAKCEDEDFTSQFAGVLTRVFTVVKGGTGATGEIDAISGATITSRAVTEAVNGGLAYFETFIKNATEGGDVNE